MSEKTTTRKYIQGIAFFLFIVGLPLGSWYFLQTGFDYHKDLMAELNNYGRIPTFELVDQRGNKMTREDMEGKMLVVNFFNPNADSYAPTMEYLRKMNGQFHDRSDLLFVSHALQSNTDLKGIAEKEDLENNQSVFLSGGKAELLKVLAKGYQIPDLDNRNEEDKTIPRSSDLINLPDDYPYFILVDDSGTIRNYYDVTSEKSVTKLVEHLALTLPRKSEEKAELKREKEK